MKVESKLFCIDDEDENEIEEETSQQTPVTALPSTEGNRVYFLRY